MRPSVALLLSWLLLAGGLVGLHLAKPEPSGGGEAAAEALDLTDAALSTGTRYTRAYGTTDLSSPVQVHPGGLPSYLSEGLVAPPDPEVYGEQVDGEQVGRRGLE